MRISDWSSDVCSSDLQPRVFIAPLARDIRGRCGKKTGFRGSAGDLSGDGRGLFRPWLRAGDASPRLCRRTCAVRPRRNRKGGILTWGLARSGGRSTRKRKGEAHHEHARRGRNRSEEHTSELQSLMRISYAVFCLKKKNNKQYSPHIPSDLHAMKNTHHNKTNTQ